MLSKNPEQLGYFCQRICCQDLLEKGQSGHSVTLSKTLSFLVSLFFVVSAQVDVVKNFNNNNNKYQVFLSNALLVFDGIRTSSERKMGDYSRSDLIILCVRCPRLSLVMGKLYNRKLQSGPFSRQHNARQHPT